MTEEDEEVESALQSLSVESARPFSRHPVQTLAAASKKSETVRRQLSRPTILKTITACLAGGGYSSALTDSALRCIANACADNDDARDIICSEGIGFAWATKCLQSEDQGIRLLTTKVLNNVCCDHEESQRLCYREGIHWDLIRFLNSKMVRDMSIECKVAGELDGAIDVLFWVSGQKVELEKSQHFERKTLPYDDHQGLLKLYTIWTKEWNIETFATISETVLVFLRDPTVQRQIISHNSFERVWAILEKQDTLINDPNISVEDQKLLKPLQASLVWCLSDISANQAFPRQYPLECEEMFHLRTIIQSASENTAGQKLNATAQVLGNLLWAQKDPQSYSRLILETELHIPLLNTIVSEPCSPPDTLHSIAGLLIQLCRPPSREVRDMIGGYRGTRQAIERLCRHERPEIKQGGVKLVKALGKDCQENQRRFAELAGEAIAAMPALDVSA